MTVAENSDDWQLTELWSVQTSAIFNAAGTPMIVNCSSVELDDSFRAPLREIIEHYDETRNRLDKAEEDIRAAITGIASQVPEVEYRFREPFPFDKMGDPRLFRYALRFREAQDKIETIRAEQEEQRRIDAAILTEWLGGLGINIVGEIEPGDVFFSAQALEDRTQPFPSEIITRLVDKYDREIRELNAQEYAAIYEILLRVPLPVYGSAPQTFDQLAKFLGSGGYVVGLVGVHETEGPVMVVVTLIATFLIWVGKPSAEVARQALKNWTKKKLGVKKIDGEKK